MLQQRATAASTPHPRFLPITPTTTFMRVHFIETAFLEAAADFNHSLSFIRPYRSPKEGYCEANLTEYFSHALREHDFRPFLEFPVAGGRIDGLFFRDSALLVVEAKQLHRGTLTSIKSDLTRLAALPLRQLLSTYRFLGHIKDVFEVVVCDCWYETEKLAWNAPSTHPFLNGYEVLAADLPNGHSGSDRFCYSWLLAYRQTPNTSSCQPTLLGT